MSEKRYFKLLSSRHVKGEKNNYLVLFDVLDKAQEEDEIAIRKELMNKKINVEFYSADKNYLYHQIIKSLNDFHFAKTYNLEIKEYLLSIEILFHKGLYKECTRLIDRAEKLAKKCENFPLLIDLLNWKKKCMGYSMGLSKASEVNKEIESYLEILNNQKRITDLYYQSYELISKEEKIHDSETIQKLKRILSQPEIKDEGKCLSFSARVFRKLIFSHFYLAVNEKRNELEMLHDLIEDLDQNEVYKEENPLDYISIFNRFLEIKKQFANDDFTDYIKKLKEFPKSVKIKKETSEERVFIHCHTHEMEYYLLKNDYEKALQKSKEIDKEIARFKLNIEPFHLIYFYYSNAIALLFLGENKKALKFILNVLLKFKSSDRPQAYRRLELLYILTHFELGNSDLVESFSKKLLAEDKKDEILLPFEKLLMKSLLEILNSEKKKKNTKEENWKNLSLELQKEKTNSNPTYLNLLNNYQKWIELKSLK